LDRVRVCQNTDDLPGLIDALWAAHLVISVDTSVGHLAAGMHKPLVAIYPLVGAATNDPWRLQPQPSTVMIYSPVDPIIYRATGLKCLDNYRDETLLHGVMALGVASGWRAET